MTKWSQDLCICRRFYEASGHHLGRILRGQCQAVLMFELSELLSLHWPQSAVNDSHVTYVGVLAFTLYLVRTYVLFEREDPKISKGKNRENEIFRLDSLPSLDLLDLTRCSYSCIAGTPDGHRGHHIQWHSIWHSNDPNPQIPVRSL